MLNNLQSLVVKPVYRSHQEVSICARELTNEQLDELRQRLLTNPMQYVAQPMLQASNLPTLHQGRITSRPTILRSFSVAMEASSYSVMPGGLTRVALSEDDFIISNQVGSRSKDTWIISSEPIKSHAQISTEQAGATRDADLISLPSRVVENLFWMGRYAERAEASLRLLRTVFMMLNGEEPISHNCRRILLQTVTEVTATRPGFIDGGDELIDAPDDELLRVVADQNLSGSVISNLNAMLFSADESKELLSSDTLGVINDVRDALSELDFNLSQAMVSAPEEALDPLVTALMALSGLSHESMIRDSGWRFMDIGRRLERAQQLTHIINGMVVPEAPEADQNVLLQSLLLSVEALISYRRRYRARTGVQSTLDLVLLDTDNPRSLLYQLETLSEHIRKLPRAPENKHELPPEERATLQVEALIKLSLLSDFTQRENGERPVLKQTLETVNQTLGTISHLVSDKYFAHRETSQQLVSSLWENN